MCIHRCFYINLHYTNCATTASLIRISTLQTDECQYASTCAITAVMCIVMQTDDLSTVIMWSFSLTDARYTTPNLKNNDLSWWHVSISHCNSSHWTQPTRAAAAAVTMTSYRETRLTHSIAHHSLRLCKYSISVTYDDTAYWTNSVLKITMYFFFTFFQVQMEVYRTLLIHNFTPTPVRVFTDLKMRLLRNQQH